MHYIFHSKLFRGNCHETHALRRWFKHSLPAKAALAVTLITVLALSSALSAVVIASISKDDAAAINAAGSLRMATYRLIWRLDTAAPRSTINNLKADMQQRLASPELRQVAERQVDSSTALAFLAINEHWQNVVLPVLDHKTKSVFIAEAEHFVLQLEKFIDQLQRQSENRQKWQQGIQCAALMLTILILLIGLHQLKSSVIRPLKQLVDSARRFSRGDLNARITYRSEDELGQMAESFNAMAEVIKQSHLNLEDRINEKTRDLEQTNSTLQMLYQSSQSLATNAANIEQLNNLIDRFQQRFSNLHLTLRLHKSASSKRAQQIILRGNQQRETCPDSNLSDDPLNQHPAVSVFAITSQGVRLGELRAIFSDGHALRTWETELIQALANLIGTSLSLEQQREQENRLLLLAERATIARELHDSLAQALSYMKLQVSRMNTLIKRQEPTQHLLEVNEELRDGLNSAYRQLRELLTTFRLKIDGSGLENALKQTAEEFAQRGAGKVILNTPSLAFSLSAAEQIHLLQIVREALSNCAQHAVADHVWVTISQHGEFVRLLIEDDGCGIDSDYDQRQHHGLNIMRERAQSIGGQFSVACREAGGTRIEMQFKAVFFSGCATETSA